MKGQEKYNSPFAANLRDLIAQKGTTITALAKVLGISRQAVSQYADGTGQPNVDKLAMIADYFGVSADYLLGLSDIPTRNETVRGIHEKTGLWESAISALMKDYLKADCETASFISYLTVNKKISRLVGAIKRKNEVSSDSKDLKVDIGGEQYKAEMKALFKMIVSDLFFEIIAGYTAKPGEIMLDYKAGESDG